MVILPASIHSDSFTRHFLAIAIRWSMQKRRFMHLLIVFVVPGVGHLTDLVLPEEGIFEYFFARRGDI